MITTDITPSALAATKAALSSLATLPAERDLIAADDLAGITATIAAAIDADTSLDDTVKVTVLAQVETLAASATSHTSRAATTDALLDILSALL